MPNPNKKIHHFFLIGWVLYNPIAVLGVSSISPSYENPSRRYTKMKVLALGLRPSWVHQPQPPADVGSFFGAWQFCWWFFWGWLWKRDLLERLERWPPTNGDKKVTLNHLGIFVWGGETLPKANSEWKPLKIGQGTRKVSIHFQGRAVSFRGGSCLGIPSKIQKYKAYNSYTPQN